MRTLLFSLVALTAVGCAPQARVMVLRPAEVDIAGIHRLAVVDFTGHGETGREARSALAMRLAEKRHYTLVDQGELSRVEPAAFTGPQLDESRVIQAARHAEVDGLVTGQVVAYDAGSGSTLTNPPTVTLAVKLIDVSTGVVRDARQITRTFKSREVPDRQAALQGLLSDCAEELAARITPHQELVAVELAGQYWGTGMTNVHRGNVLAREGEWREAAAAWQKALDENPKNHVALHNLAIASFAQGDQAQAATQLDRAIGLFAAATYQQNRKLLAAQQSLAQVAMAQQGRPSLSGDSPRLAPSDLGPGLQSSAAPALAVGPPEPPQILPSTGSVIPAALQSPVPADGNPQRLPAP
jgi:tetratricopeptide (TPR) repeat protein